MKHTPTPWIITDNDNIVSKIENIILFEGTNGSAEQRKCNAEFIVRAVNNHDDLLKIAKSYLITLESLEKELEAVGMSHILKNYLIDMLKNFVIEKIKKVEGK